MKLLAGLALMLIAAFIAPEGQIADIFDYSDVFGIMGAAVFICAVCDILVEAIK